MEPKGCQTGPSLKDHSLALGELGHNEGRAVVGMRPGRAELQLSRNLCAEAPPEWARFKEKEAEGKADQPVKPVQRF